MVLGLLLSGNANADKIIFIVKHESLEGEWKDKNKQKAIEKCLNETPDWGIVNCHVIGTEVTLKVKDVVKQIKEVNNLYKEGYLTMDEFKKAKELILR